MRKFAVVILLVIQAASLAAQSGRAVKPTPTGSDTRSIRDLFQEANSYRKTKFEEFEAKKIGVSERLRLQTELEQRRLAAKLAQIGESREGLATDDLYFLALLHWISENLESTSAALQRYLDAKDPDPARVQTALSLKSVVAARQGKFDVATTSLAEYAALGAGKPSEVLKMNAELAKAYLAGEQPAKAAPHAAEAFEISKSLTSDPKLKAAGLDLAYDNATMLFNAHRGAGNIAGAEAALTDLRKLAGSLGNASFFYYAADKLITYQIETGRKELALGNFLSMLIAATKELPLEGQRTDAINRLKRREKHYRLMGSAAPEFVNVDKWFPGNPVKIAELKGKVILLDFWATWCAPCFDAFPSLIEWDRDLKDKGFVVLGFTRYYGRDESRPANEPEEIKFLERFREKHKLPYDIIVGKDQATQILYGATALPTVVLIDRKGVVRYIEIGTSSSRLVELREMILKLIDEEA